MGGGRRGSKRNPKGLAQQTEVTHSIQLSPRRKKEGADRFQRFHGEELLDHPVNGILIGFFFIVSPPTDSLFKKKDKSLDLDLFLFNREPRQLFTKSTYNSFLYILLLLPSFTPPPPPLF